MITLEKSPSVGTHLAAADVPVVAVGGLTAYNVRRVGIVARIGALTSGPAPLLA